jgi:hypothetical protein
MLFSPEIDAMKEQMTAVIVRDSEGFFDDPKESTTQVARVLSYKFGKTAITLRTFLGI